MKKLLLAATAFVAVCTSANAVDLTCSKPMLYVGTQSRDAKDTVIGVAVHHDRGSGWQVHHRLGSGLIAEREYQYTINDLSNQSQTVWRGLSNKYPGFWMRGEIQREINTDRLMYVERLYNGGGELKMHAAAYCTEQVAALRPPATTSVPAAPTPAPAAAPPPAAPPTVTLPTVIVNVPPAIVQNPPPVPPPPAVQNPAPAPPPAAQNPVPEQPPAKPPRRNSVPITVYNERAVLIDVGMGRQVVNMMLDTGASTSAITEDVANALVRDGHARWLGTRKFQMADGSTTEALALVINEVRIGSHVVRDVEASVVPNGTRMLLGFPVVNQIGPFTINTRTRELVFEEEA